MAQMNEWRQKISVKKYESARSVTYLLYGVIYELISYIVAFSLLNRLVWTPHLEMNDIMIILAAFDCPKK